ncbi:MAG: DUF975 family protein [Clostridiales bacterium]|nr:DUF975 family protein [Clostridiales bacterium]
MNNEARLSRAGIKKLAKMTMHRWQKACLATAVIVVVAGAVSLLFRLHFGGVLEYYMFDAGSYTTGTGLWRSENGFTAVFRMDEMGSIFALPLSFAQLRTYLLVQAAMLFLSAPLTMGALEQLSGVSRGQVRPLSALFLWYREAGRTLKAVGLSLLLTAVRLLSVALGTLPGLGLFLWLSGGGAAMANTLSPLWSILMLAGVAGALWVNSLFAPAQYMMARNPALSVIQAVTDGIRVMAGRRRWYFFFSLSFLPWYMLVNVTGGAMNLFVFPYASLANFLLLRLLLEPEFKAGDGLGMPSPPPV